MAKFDVWLKWFIGKKEIHDVSPKRVVEKERMRFWNA